MVIQKTITGETSGKPNRMGVARETAMAQHCGHALVALYLMYCVKEALAPKSLNLLAYRKYTSWPSLSLMTLTLSKLFWIRHQVPYLMINSAYYLAPHNLL
jgi:hypothetical protein